jgi:Ni/Co efflux regulator RcnB
MSKLLIALLFAAFAITSYAADTDKQTDGAELGTNETPQAKDQSKSNRKKNSGTHAHKPKRANTQSKHNHPKANGSEDNPLQPTESEPAPGASTQ